MKGRLWPWLNSIRAHMILLALGTIAAITAINIIAINIDYGPSSSPVSLYEMTRIVRGLEIVQIPPKLIERGRVAQAPASEGSAERVISRLLAARLALPERDVRVRLQSDRYRPQVIVDEARIYADEGAANPALLGGFTIYIRQTDGAWHTHSRIVDYWQARSVRFWRYATYYLGILIVLPLAMLFSARFNRPVQAFAASADRIGAGRYDRPVPVAGPTEIRQAAVALNDMQERIAHLVRERTALVGAIAHDLRTPLSNLRFRIANADAETRASAEAEIRHMEQLIGSTLDYVDGEGRPLIAEPLDLGSLLQTLADDCRDRGANVAFVPTQKLTVRGDIIRLRRLFGNLMENALKFGSRVDLTYDRDGDAVVVDFVDDGPGMAEEDLPRAFDPFFRGERSRNRSTGGIGLGLAIAESAARAHEGSIELSNVPGGFRARVRLPIGAATATAM
ncbi:sensor histidine kinase [Novosphingobium sp. JCM 18896]|uniref:sensor histidine kinase n=1 Tax=Novosphingobium sp. JCM 18896 TaxID=2989731 RepID=UPI002221F8E4|nr:HAMP domain-containing sensor histidine kinase [Novosphingobium sp. JCM 18896]